MPRKPQVTDQVTKMAFPLQGIDLSTGYNRQRPGTTPVGQNVRSYDAGTLRMRGGSRSGLTSFLGAGSTAQVNGFALIQNLNVIVTVSELATFTGVLLGNLQFKVNYSETDHPPARNAPQVLINRQWFSGTKPSFTLVSGATSPPDGGGTGMGTCSINLSTDGTTVTATGTFISAGFPPPGGGYFYSGGSSQVEVRTLTNVLFFPPGTTVISFAWTVVNFSTGFIGNLFVDISTF